jgi:polyhydroxybutyrate depolymerase
MRRWLAASIACLVVVALFAAGPVSALQEDGEEAQVIEPGESYRVQFMSGDLMREYIIYIPTGYDPDAPAPLVLSFHAYGTSPEQQRDLSQMSEMADEETFIVVYPAASDDPPEWAIWASEAAAGVDDVAFVRDLLDSVAEHASFDPARVYAAGFSNGGGLAGRLACELSDQITAIAQVSGTYLVPEDCTPTRPVPVAVVHGTADGVLPYGGVGGLVLPARTYAANWAARNGCEAGPAVTFEEGTATGETWTDCLDDADVVFYTIEDGTHSWPRGEVNASDLIWSFFQAHAIPGEPSAAVPLPDETEVASLALEPGDQFSGLIVGWLPRQFLLHIPPGYDHEGDPMPLVLNFHGLTADPESEADVSQTSALADVEGFIVAYPEGLGNPRGWYYAGDGRGPDDVGFTDALIDYLLAELNVDPARVYVMGMSNGGGMANRAACELSDRVAAMASVAGAYQYTEDCELAHPVPVIGFHGTGDEIVSYTGRTSDGVRVLPAIPQWAAEWAAHNGCEAGPTTMFQMGEVSAEMWAECLDDANVMLYTIEGGGHDWPHDEPIPGRDNYPLTDVSATDVIWHFFESHTLKDEPSAAVATQPSAGEAGETVTDVVPGDYIGTVDMGGDFRQFVLHIPQSYTDDEPVPLVLAYHGYGDEPVNFALASGLLQVSEVGGFVVVFPEGSGDPRYWAAQPGDLTDDVQFTRDLIDRLTRDINIDPARIYATGMSNGGRMVNRLGCEMADQLAAIVPVAAGAYTGECDPARPIPVLAIHGTADSVVPYNGDYDNPSVEAWVSEWAARNGCASDPGEREASISTEMGDVTVHIHTWQGCDEGADVMLHAYEDWGHFWPGNVGAEVAWAFFTLHTLPQPESQP